MNQHIDVHGRIIPHLNMDLIWRSFFPCLETCWLTSRRKILVKIDVSAEQRDFRTWWNAKYPGCEYILSQATSFQNICLNNMCQQFLNYKADFNAELWRFRVSQQKYCGSDFEQQIHVPLVRRGSKSLETVLDNEPPLVDRQLCQLTCMFEGFLVGISAVSH